MPLKTGCNFCVFFALYYLLSAGLCLPATAADFEVEKANYVAPPLSESTGQIVRFSQQATEVGSGVMQQVSIDLEINSTIVQSGQIANQSTTKIRRRQQRFIEVTEVVAGRVHQAKVSFPHSRVMSPENPDPTAEVTQAVEGKSYLVARDSEQLFITDTDGVLPSIEEYEIVLASIQTLGLPNPLAKYLTSRTIRLGDRLQLPQEIANRLMGFGDELGQVQQFELVLKELRQINGQLCALFEATIKIADGSDGSTKIDAQGQVTIETATCRTVAANLSGPLNMKAFDANYQYRAEGGLRVAIQSRYGTARK